MRRRTSTCVAGVGAAHGPNDELRCFAALHSYLDTTTQNFGQCHLTGTRAQLFPGEVASKLVRMPMFSLLSFMFT